jgi:hypothetical protein
MPETTNLKTVLVSSSQKALGCLTKANQFFKCLTQTMVTFFGELYGYHPDVLQKAPSQCRITTVILPAG